MPVLPEHPTITIDMVAVTNVINKAIENDEKEDGWKLVGMEQLGIVQMFLIRAMGSMAEPYWEGDAPMTIQDVGAILTAMAILIRDNTDGFADPNNIAGLKEGCTAILTAAECAIRDMQSARQSEGGDASIWDLDTSSSK